MTNTATAQKLTASQPTPSLVTSLLLLEEQMNTMDPVSDDAQAYRLTRAWILTELEHRFPDADAAVEAAFDNAADDEDVNYVAVLIANIPLAEF